MTQDAELDEAAAGAPDPGPRLIHHGTYALYETPGGGRHLVWRRLASINLETGELEDIDGADDEHLPDIPREALPLVSAFTEHGIPPAILAVLQGGQNGAMGRLAALRGMLAGLPDEGQAEGEGGGDGGAG
jgi:hypothetical protein